MGEAGLDLASLAQALIEAADAGYENDLGAVAVLPLNPVALEYLEEAKTRLGSEQEAACSTDINSQECKDLSFQISILSLSSTVTALAE